MVKFMMGILIVLGVALYLGGIVLLGVLGLRQAETPTLQGWEAGFVALASLLSVNFGATLGIEMVQGGGGRSFLMLLSKDGKKPFKWPTVQELFAGVYLLGLLMGAAFVLIDADSSHASPVLTDLVATLVGAILGAFAVFLNIKRP